MALADERDVESKAGYNGSFDRQPPQDIAAEQSVLGGMMLSKDAIADVVEKVRPHDFYRPAHQAIYDCVLDLYGRGEPADAITVSAELERRQELVRVGGAPYMHTLIATVPTAANAGYYAEIVAEKAVLRRLVEAGTRIVQLGYNGSEGSAIDEVVDRAQAAIYDVTERRASEDYAALEDLLQPTMDEIDAIASRGGDSLGLPTGFADLDGVTNGLHPGQMIIVAARPGVGKALALDTALPTPTGWTTMGEVREGEQLLGANGKPTKVVAATDVLHGRPCYEVEFSDGTIITADAQHQWKITTRAHRRQITEAKSSSYWSKESIDRVEAAHSHSISEADHLISTREALALVGAEFANTVHRIVTKVWNGDKALRPFSGPQRSGSRPTPVFSKQKLLQELHQWITLPINASTTTGHSGVATTEELHTHLRCRDGRLNYAVSTAAPLSLPTADLLIQPYTLGAWLGDGNSQGPRITSADPQIAVNIENEGLHVRQCAGLNYSISAPEPPRTRVCFVCDTTFTPSYFSVRACSYACAGKARSGGIKPEPLACINCGRPPSGMGQRCQQCHDRHGTFTARLRTLGVLENKHIPAEYLRASDEQRRELLAGLLDTDGTVGAAGGISFGVTHERLARDAQELILSLGYRCSRTTKQVQGRNEKTSTYYKMHFTTEDEVFRLDRKNLAHKRRKAANTRRTTVRYITDVRPVPSVPVRCVEVDAADHLYLAGRSMIPTHNSTLGLDFARAASVKHGMGSVIFSLEMGRTEIVMRMLSAEARIRLADMRGGRMTDEDWTRLARRMSEISEAPLFVDDSPNLTMMEIRAKARRLKQRNDIQLIVVDYMQLMTSGKRVESRQQEVSEFSRNLKLLAKELEVPVVAISQLNRGPEQRNDKKPQLADLRESGCLTAETRLLRADTGTEVTFAELMRTGEKPIVWSLNDRMRLVPRPITNVFSSGVKEAFKVRLASGREIEATANHPMLTVDGWVPLGELTEGFRVAVPGEAPEPLATTPMPEQEVVLLAHLIGEGSFVRRQPIRYASVDEANLHAVTDAARHFSVNAVRDEYPSARVTTLRLPAPYRLTHGKRNPIAAWLDEHGLFGLRSHEKFIPDRVFSLPREQIALFLRHLWATDGSVRWDEKVGQARLYYASASRRLADDVSRLLLRIGVFARTKAVEKSGYHTCYHVLIHGAENQLKFLDSAGIHGARSFSAAIVVDKLRSITGNTNRDTVPKAVWDRVRERLAARSMTHRDFSARMETQFCGSTMWKRSPSRTRLARAAAVLADAELETLATNDVFWDEIAEITSIGEQPVFDATVDETHNFVANSIVMHNSLEQDADMVVLIHRPDAFERDDPRMGEADLILAKHRAGPVSTVTVAHQLHYSRFVDMAQE